MRKQHLLDLSFRSRKGDNGLISEFLVEEQKEINDMLAAMKVNELALSQLELRLNSLSDYNDIVGKMNSTFDELRQITKEISTFATEVKSESDDMNILMKEILMELGNLTVPVVSPVMSEEGDQLITEATMYLKMREQKAYFAPSVEGMREIADPFSRWQSEALIESDDEVTQLVRSYVEREGDICVERVSKDLGLDREEVERAILRIYEIPQGA